MNEWEIVRPIFDPVWIGPSNEDQDANILSVVLPASVIWVRDPLFDYIDQLGDA